jgi:two-component system, chemotaxis family, CheB/CheR fusion protein
VLFLGTDLRVRRYTPAMNDLLELIPTDIGRPVVHLAQKFSDGDLAADARAVLERLVPVESEVRSHSGRWYLKRATAYRTADNRIDGVVIVFVDISARRAAEQAVTEANARLTAVIDQMPAAVLVIDAPSGTLRLGNRRAADLLGRPCPLPFVGTHWSGGARRVRCDPRG